MATRARKRSLMIQAESSYGTDPTSGDSGATLALVPAEDLGMLEDGIAVHETNWHSGRNTDTIAELGVDGVALKFTTPIRGLTAVAGDEGSPPAADWLTMLLDSAFGAHTDIAGEGVDAGSAAGTLVTDSGPGFGLQDLIPVHEAAINSARTQWRRSASTGTPFTIAPNWTATPGTDAIAYGYERWRPSDAAGTSFALYYDLDGTPYVLTGGNAVGCTIKGEAGKRITADWQVRCDAKSQASRASAPAIDTYVGPVAVLGAKSQFFWGSTAYALKSFSLDFGINAMDSPSIAATNGRANIETVRTQPVLTIEVPWVVGWETAFRAGTADYVLLQMGGGVLASSVLNTLCWHCTKAQVVKPPEAVDDNGVLRWRVQLKVVDPGIFTGTTAGVFWQLARA